MLRARMHPRLEAAGIRVDWRVEDLPPIADLTPHRVLQILRILQDAFGLVLSHREARSVCVITGSRQGRAPHSFVEIADAAAGVAAGSWPELTLERMQACAREIGAPLEIRPSSMLGDPSTTLASRARVASSSSTSKTV